jgi:hypothetical protein
MARAMIDRSEFSPDDWRGLGKHLRELALGTMDDNIRARMNEQAQKYEVTADCLDKTGLAPAPIQKALAAMPKGGFAVSSATSSKSRLFRRMLAWRPRRLKDG